MSLKIIDTWENMQNKLPKKLIKLFPSIYLCSQKCLYSSLYKCKQSDFLDLLHNISHITELN